MELPCSVVYTLKGMIMETMSLPSATGSITDAAEEALTYALAFAVKPMGSAVDSISAKSGTTVDLSAYTSAREGFSFNGWYSDPTLANKVESVTTYRRYDSLCGMDRRRHWSWWQ